MTTPPPQHYSPIWADDTRVTPPLVGDEREILTAYLDLAPPDL